LWWPARTPQWATTRVELKNRQAEIFVSLVASLFSPLAIKLVDQFRLHTWLRLLRIAIYKVRRPPCAGRAHPPQVSPKPRWRLRGARGWPRQYSASSLLPIVHRLLEQFPRMTEENRQVRRARAASHGRARPRILTCAAVGASAVARVGLPRRS